MTPTTVLTLDQDISVVVPDSLNLISCYVLQEQEDWFEDEIKFVRRLLQPGQKVIDIGANYGLFTLSMAKSVGPHGHVWAFEPASSTAALLAQSIAHNRYDHITLDRRALSDHEGTAQLSLNVNAELNEIVRDSNSKGPHETVVLTTLDQALEQYRWRDIDFLKIDAEGEEAAIIRGGTAFFGQLSPLVQFEVKAGEHLHLELVNQFKEIGYSAYRLVPGLNLLAPFDPQSFVDGYLLNLFCCKTDRAEQLASQGLLITEAASQALLSGDVLLQRHDAQKRYAWQQTLVAKPYGRLLTAHWQQAEGKPDSKEVTDCLALHAIAHDRRLSAAERYAALKACLEGLIAVCNQNSSFLRVLSLARVAREFGARSLAVQCLNHFVQHCTSGGTINVSEPFLVACARFEEVDPGKELGNWVVGSALEELEKSAAFSSFYSGPASMQRLLLIQQLGFGSPEMARRLTLLKRRHPAHFGQSAR